MLCDNEKGAQFYVQNVSGLPQSQSKADQNFSQTNMIILLFWTAERDCTSVHITERMNHHVNKITGLVFNSEK